MFRMIWSLYSGKHDSEIFCTIIWFLIILLTQRGTFIRLNLFPQNWTVSGRTGRPLSSCNFGEFWVSASSVPLSVCIIHDSARYSCVYLLALWGTIRPALILNVLICVKNWNFSLQKLQKQIKQSNILWPETAISNSVFCMLCCCSLLMFFNNEIILILYEIKLNPWSLVIYIIINWIGCWSKES